MNLKDIDPATESGSPELVNLIATEWMGWRPHTSTTGRIVGWTTPTGEYWSAIPGFAGVWSPFTDPAHAGEARRKATDWRLQIRCVDGTSGLAVDCAIWLDEMVAGFCLCAFAETDNDKGRAEALAAMRAILAAMKAREE